MCGRFTLTRSAGRELAASLGVADEALVNWQPRYNIAPTQEHFVVVMEFENRRAIPARWGLVNSSAKDNSRASSCINAKAEKLESRVSFREAFRRRRCVVPADGFYEWTGPQSRRTPLWIRRRDGGLILFAGLYETWYPEKGRSETTFTIITCAPNATIRRIHDRMPVILDDRDADDWMNPREADPLGLKHLLVPPPEDLLTVRPASPLVNSPNNEGPEVLEAHELFA